MRKNIFVPNYKYFTNDKDLVVAVCNYAGRSIRGEAKCAPEDEFDYEKGRQLAKARCDVKIARLKFNNARFKKNMAKAKVEMANSELIKYQNYLVDAIDELNEADNVYLNIISSL